MVVYLMKMPLYGDIGDLHRSGNKGANMFVLYHLVNDDRDIYYLKDNGCELTSNLMRAKKFKALKEIEEFKNKNPVWDTALIARIDFDIKEDT